MNESDSINSPLVISFAEMAAQQYLPGLSDLLPDGEVAMYPENIFSQGDVDKIVAYWATQPYGGSGSAGASAGAQPFLVPVPPCSLITLPCGDDAYFPILLPERSDDDPNLGVWTCRADDRPRTVYAVRRNGPANNVAIPVGERKEFRGSRSDEYYKAAEVGESAKMRWSELYPDGPPNQPEFPLDSKSPGRMMVNIDRILWRWHWRAPLPLQGMDISHLAAPAHYHELRNPGSPYHTIGLVVLESREVNESRKPCNMFGLWRRKHSLNTPIVPDETMDLLQHVVESGGVPVKDLQLQGCCVHALVAHERNGKNHSWPCYGPIASAVPRDPTLLTGGRYNFGPRKFKHPQKGHPGSAGYHHVPTGSQLTQA